ncbi:MAG: PilZ domain-containing protein [Myxococcales bacterium]|nr:PilZ domain-containing protein [Myxococcales bacterium]
MNDLIEAPELLEESRRVARRWVELDCELITKTADRPLPSRCLDLSPLGMALTTQVVLADGEEVVVSFRPPREDEEMILFGRVRHAVPSGQPTGVAFEATTIEERISLFDALRGIPPRLPHSG